MKHPYQDFSPLESAPAKRIRTSQGVQQYTEAEQWTLQGAAKILGIPVEDLVKAVNAFQQSLMNPSTPQSRHTPSVSSRDDEPTSSSLSPISAEAQWPSTTMPPYEHSAGPRVEPAMENMIPWLDNNPIIETSHNVDSASSLHGWHDPLSGFHFPNYEPAPVFNNGDPPFCTFDDTSLGVPTIHRDSLNVNNPATLPPSSVAQESLQSPAPGPGFLQEQLPSLELLSRPLNTLHEVPTSPLRDPSEEMHDKQTKPLSPKTAVGKKGKRTGPFLDQSKRDETALTRLNKACISCRMQKILCKRDPMNPDPKGICQTCIDFAPKRIHWFPCLRMNLSNAELLDHGVCPRPSWTRRWKKMEILNIRDWKSAEIKTIKITQDVKGRCYQVRVRQFEPKDGDAMERKWKTRGVEHSFKCAPYAIADMEEAGRTLSEFADRTLADALSFYTQNSDTLLRSTYEMAYKYAKTAEREEERLLLSNVLRLWCASRMESRSDRICGEETLGMKPRDYGADCPNSGIVLTPPVFSAQLEVIVVSTILQPTKKLVLKQLFKLMTKKSKQSWLCIYLCIFILLHNCALATASAHKRAKKQGYQSRYFDSSIIKSLHHGATVLLAYFHFYNAGSYPFTLDWLSKDQIACAEFSTEHVAFMRETIKEANNKASLFSQIKEIGEFEHDYYFLSQLFETNWSPQHTI